MLHHLPKNREPAGPLATEETCGHCNVHLDEPSSGRYIAPVETYKYILEDLAHALGVQIHGRSESASADNGRALVERHGPHAKFRALADVIDLHGLVVRPGDERQVYVQSEASDLDCILEELRYLRTRVDELEAASIRNGEVIVALQDEVDALREQRDAVRAALVRS